MDLTALPRPLAFVFSGGAALGALQVGMLRAALERGLTPDMVVGTSVGALNGALLCDRPDDAADLLSRLWGQLRRQDVFPGGWAGNVRALALRRTHLFPATGLNRLISGSLRAKRFDELALPLAVVATDGLTGHPIVLRDGLLSPALLASTAIPGLFPAVAYRGTHLVDGGLAANVPILPALEQGARSMVVFDAAGFCHRSLAARSLVETMLFSSSILLRHQVTCDVARAAAQVPVLYPPGPCLVGRSPLDFGASAGLIRDGHEQATTFFASTRISGAGLYGHPHQHGAS